MQYICLNRKSDVKKLMSDCTNSNLHILVTSNGMISDQFVSTREYLNASLVIVSDYLGILWERRKTYRTKPPTCFISPRINTCLGNAGGMLAW